MDFLHLKKKLFISLVLGLVIFVILGLYSDFNKIMESVSRFDLRYLPVILMLAPLNYILRYVKWNYYLKILKINIDSVDNAKIFTAGLSMTVTPGKLGEFLKSYLIKEFKGVSISVTSPMIVIERLTDGISMIILASIGALRFRYGIGALVSAVLLSAFFIAFIRIRPFALRVIGFLKKMPVLKRIGVQMDAFYQSSYELLGIRTFSISVAIGILSWGFEGLVLFLTLKAFNHPISILSSVFVVAFSSIVGALSMLPGGLVVAEGSILGLLLMMDLPKEIASASTIVTRFSTLWLGVLIGIAGLVSVRKVLDKGKGEIS
ncbi:MAG: lysylphosphatidylglycerol synthase transmembrane domain-containing protein [Acetivibrionales bacterium]